MQEFTMRDIMRVLEEGWGEYVGQFKLLSPDEQTKFVQKQGYKSFHDLVAHIVGWWEEGLWVITGILDDPSFTWETRNTDAFNRELIDKYDSWSEENLLLHFENVREATLELVSELGDNALMNKDIRTWLYENVIGHLDDHKIQ